MMKKIIKLIMLFLTVFMLFTCSSCVTMCMLQKKLDKEFYSNDSNYLQFTGVIVEIVYFNDYSYGSYQSLFMIEASDEAGEKGVGKFQITTDDAPNLPERGYIAKVGDEVAFMAAIAGGMPAWSITEFYANGVCYITHEEGKEMRLSTL